MPSATGSRRAESSNGDVVPWQRELDPVSGQSYLGSGRATFVPGAFLAHQEPSTTGQCLRQSRAGQHPDLVGVFGPFVDSLRIRVIRSAGPASPGAEQTPRPSAQCLVRRRECRVTVPVRERLPPEEHDQRCQLNGRPAPAGPVRSASTATRARRRSAGHELEVQQLGVHRAAEELVGHSIGQCPLGHEQAGGRALAGDPAVPVERTMGAKAQVLTGAQLVELTDQWPEGDRQLDVEHGERFGPCLQGQWKQHAQPPRSAGSAARTGASDNNTHSGSRTTRPASGKSARRIAAGGLGSAVVGPQDAAVPAEIDRPIGPGQLTPQHH